MKTRLFMVTRRKFVITTVAIPLVCVFYVAFCLQVYWRDRQINFRASDGEVLPKRGIPAAVSALAEQNLLKTGELKPDEFHIGLAHWHLMAPTKAGPGWVEVRQISDDTFDVFRDSFQSTECACITFEDGEWVWTWLDWRHLYPPIE